MTSQQLPCRIAGQRGSITVLNIFAIVACVALVLLTANIGNIWLRRSAAQDAAEMLAPLLLNNQLSYKKITGAPNTQTLTTTLMGEANLAQSLGSVSVQYTFGTSNGATFSPIASTDPNPSTTSFNAIAVEVRTTPINLGNLFGLSFGAVKGRAIAAVDSTAAGVEDCVCDVKCGDLFFMMKMMCLMGCVFSSLLEMMTSIFSLSGSDFLDALTCLLDTLFLLPVTAWDWAWTTASVIIQL